MRRRMLIALAASGVALLVMLLLVGALLGSPPSKVSAQPPPIPHYKCYDIAGLAPQFPPVTLETQFGVEQGVPVGAPAKLCLPAGKNGEPLPPPDWPVLKCYSIAGQNPHRMARLETQFGIEYGVGIGQATLLCVPAAMTITPALPAPLPPPPDRHWECFNIAGSDPPNVVDLETQFGVELGVAVGQATKLCAPALKNGEGDLEAFPHLKCYNITGAPPAVPPVNLTTQFGIEEGVPVGPPSLLCAPALKQLAVGGVAELPAVDGGLPLAEESGGLSTGAYAAMIAGVAGAALVLSAGAVYARRRWLK
jgi:hypothetical protein